MDRLVEEAPIPQVIFDTDVLVWFFRGNQHARSFIASVPGTERGVSALTEMELVQGCRHRAEVRELKAFLTTNIPHVAYPDEAISRRASGLLEEHAAAHGLRVVDALIAATAIELGCPLATGNMRHYRAIASLDLKGFRP